MKRALALVVLAVSLLLEPARGVEPIVRAEIDSEVVTVGQKVELRITILVPTWFKNPPHFPTFEIASAITRLPPDSSYPTSENVDGERWSGIIREYEIYPLSAARYRISPQRFQVEFVNPDDLSTVAVDVEIALPEFRAQVPVGAERLEPFLSGKKLELERVVDGETEGLEAGDAVVVRTIAKLDGMPAIFIPPLADGTAIAGLAIYPGQTIVEDGDVAHREESVTYVFERGGRYTVPPITLEWWNTESEEIDAASLPAMEFAVEGPSMIIADAVASDRTPAVIGAFLVAGVLAALLFRYRIGSSIADWGRRRLDDWKASEGYAFREIHRVARSGDAVRFYESILLWLERFEPGMTTEQLAAHSGIEELGPEIERLSRGLYLSAQGDIDLVEIEHLLGQARKTILSARRRASVEVLPPLNPR